MSKKICLKEFIDKNEKILVIFGILLAILTISFDFINNLNKEYAGYIALIICGIITLLIYEMRPKENEDFSIKLMFFYISLIAITGMIFLVIYEEYNQEFKHILNLIKNIIIFGTGIGLGILAIKYYEKNKKNILLKIIIFISSILLFLLFKYPDRIINHILLNFEINNINIFKQIEIGLGGFLMIIFFLDFEIGNDLIKYLKKKIKKFKKKN